ncbi:hypothetical protein BKP35_06680 [Anaerobacillus arseniciselenatis]|uniref:PepSY domain-containing protein n=1 Tax=Anaerobacillus arseniciselenatis TaxID=85682 RepID=A0A1S2LSB7_9BACI|nr:hypothetical protein [Anaerobacillus arseniciselenatis]OIJ14557.1 hypothetical protein BKP35_06680 [Anaerobacillus arseniciselenatis]
MRKILVMLLISLFFISGCGNNISEQEAINIAVEYANEESMWEWEFKSAESNENRWIVYVQLVGDNDVLEIELNSIDGKIVGVNQVIE